MRADPSPSIDGVSHLRLERHEDSRGFLVETFRASWFELPTFVQANLSRSKKGVLRGLHYHQGQEDLWFVPDGRVFVALVDLRSTSPTFMAHETFELSGPRSVHIPVGVAHGFYATTDALMSYFVTNYYDGSDEHGVAWNDPDIAIEWPDDHPILSDRDQNNPYWVQVPISLRPGSAT
ncbi:dTDP-4-dehydrorhamnose 3,5-epimerase [bacterium BMS3Bbin01]|nr:dTDP-4-dehydrorhamnose 3,5-epimerase [bacterium BMS3Bbin01]